MNANIELSKPELRKISELTNWEHNPRTVDKMSFERLKQQITRLGVIYKPLLINQNDIVLGGNMRLRAFKDLGIEEVWCTKVLTDNPAQMMEIALSDNDQIGVTDEEAVAAFAAIHPIQSELYAINSAPMKLVSSVIQSLSPDPVNEDEAPEPDEVAVSVLGEVYELGRHRVMCGSATDFGDVSELLNGAEVQGVHTDPPYGMNAVSKSGVLSKTYKRDIIGDDDTRAAIDAYKTVQQICPDAKQVWWGANYYSAHLPSNECWLVWDKNNGGSDQTDAELAYTNFRSVVRMYKQVSEKSNRVHPTQKPVNLVAWVFGKFDFGQNVLDLFGGSGSTLIACEETDRTCYMMELDPLYVDVIRRRYWKLINDGNEEGWETGTPAVEGAK